MDAGILEALNTPVAAPPGQSVKEKNSDVNKNEFLNLLVTQLKHQDPMNPMQNEEFAVQLAQFTQVEELMKINETLSGQTKDTGGDFSSMASYLGNEVWLNSDKVSVKNEQGGKIGFVLSEAATNVQIELVDKAGVVRQKIDAGAMDAGQQTVSLDDLAVASGEYTARVVANGASGNETKPAVSIAGIVSGFVPGPNPMLLIGDREVSTADIKRVTVPK